MRRLDDVDEALVRRINSMLWLGRYHRRSIGYYRDAGMALQELRADRSKEMWADIITEHCNISVSRAYELMAVAKGRSLKELRAEKTAAVRKYRKSKWLSKKAPPLKRSKSRIPSTTKEANHGPRTQVSVSSPSLKTTGRKSHPRIS
jgi:hypothetical protein